MLRKLQIRVDFERQDVERCEQDRVTAEKRKLLKTVGFHFRALAIAVIKEGTLMIFLCNSNSLVSYII